MYILGKCTFQCAVECTFWKIARGQSFSPPLEDVTHAKMYIPERNVHSGEKCTFWRNVHSWRNVQFGRGHTVLMYIFDASSGCCYIWDGLNTFNTSSMYQLQMVYLRPRLLYTITSCLHALEGVNL